MRVEINTPPTQDPVSVAISPDGQRLVFVASGDDGQSRIWLRPLNAITAQPLAGTEGATQPFWSPDSRSIAFFAAGALKRIDIGGGLPQMLANGAVGSGGAWSAEGAIVFARSNISPLFRIPASGGDAVAVTKLDTPRQTGHSFPQFLPGDRQFLFYVVGTEETQGIWLGSLDASETRRLTAADTAGAYVAPGWRVGSD